MEHPDDIDTRSLRIFVAVANADSVTQAAEMLGLTQSAVSQSIAKLERQLDVTLLDRSRRPLRLTAEGDILLARGREFLQSGSAIVNELRNTSRESRPRVRLGLIDSVAGTIGASLIKSIRPEAREVSVWSGISPTLRRDLFEGRLDLIVTSDPTLDKGSRHARLLREPFIAILPRSAAVADKPIEPLRMSELLPFVRYSERSIIGAEIEAALENVEQVPPRVFEFDGSDGVFAMVSGGLGWAITTPLCLHHGRMFASDVVAVPLSGRKVEREIYLASANAVGARLFKQVRESAITLLEALPLRPFSDPSTNVRIG